MLKESQQSKRERMVQVIDRLKKEYPSAISHLERAVNMYPKSIGRFHVLLGQMYIENGEIEKASAHAIRAQNINPHHEAPMELLKKINVLDID